MRALRVLLSVENMMALQRGHLTSGKRFVPTASTIIMKPQLGHANDAVNFIQDDRLTIAPDLIILIQSLFMAEATLGQLDARLIEIDDLLFKADTGQLPIEAVEREKLNGEAEAILTLLSRELGRAHNLDPRVVKEQRQSVRELNYIAALTERDLKLHPEPNPERDRIIAEVFDGLKRRTTTGEEAARKLTSIYQYMFAGASMPAVKGDAPSAPKEGFLRRLLRR
jgi:hypothetical protein